MRRAALVDQYLQVRIPPDERTNRAGMIEGDEPAEWLTPNGVQLHNAGSWIYSGAFARGPESPYWPGTAVLVEDGSPPRLLRLLADRSAQALGG